MVNCLLGCHQRISRSIKSSLVEVDSHLRLFSRVVVPL